MKITELILFGFAVALLGASQLAAKSSVDYEAFLGQHDMVWDRLPDRWEIAPYTGNGNVGFLFYQANGTADNVVSIYAGRHDYYDHRLPKTATDSPLIGGEIHHS